MCPEPLRSIVRVALNTRGMRRGEILSREWIDANFRERFITVRETKSKKNRHIPMNQQTFASWMVMSGIDLTTVQQLLGHQTYQMTLKYAHLSPEHRQSAVDILARKTGKSGPKGLKVSQIWPNPKNCRFSETRKPLWFNRLATLAQW